jgi:oligopeptide transport system permease protein
MAVTTQVKGKVATLEKETFASKSLWKDSFERLIKNKMAMLGLIIIVINILLAIFAPVFAPKDYRTQVLADNNAAPEWIISLFPVMVAKEYDDAGALINGYVTVSNDYLLGADTLGRDLLSRLIYGTRISLAVAFIGPLVSLIVGVIMGLMAGYYGGKVDSAILRLVDIFYAIPTILVILLMMAFFRGTFTVASSEGTIAYQLAALDRKFGGMFFIAVGIGITSWVGMARLTRGQALSVREQEYVVAAQSIGTKRWAIMARHVLPNILGPIIIAETLTIPAYIRYEAFLSFIGLGVNPPTPSWGNMIAEGSRSLSAYPYQAIFPALALFFIMFAFNFLGDGLRDALDPRMRGVD